VPATSAVGPGGDRARRGLDIDAAIDLQVDRLAGGVDHRADRLDLAQLALDEALPAETGIDAHHQHQIDLLEQIIEHAFDRGSPGLSETPPSCRAT
jgi:hypothetical protein